MPAALQLILDITIDLGTTHVNIVQRFLKCVNVSSERPLPQNPRTECRAHRVRRIFFASAQNVALVLDRLNVQGPCTIATLSLQARPHQILFVFSWFRIPSLELLHKSLGTTTPLLDCTGSLFARELILKSQYKCFKILHRHAEPVIVPCSDSCKIYTLSPIRSSSYTTISAPFGKTSINLYHPLHLASGISCLPGFPLP